MMLGIRDARTGCEKVLEKLWHSGTESRNRMRSEIATIVG